MNPKLLMSLFLVTKASLVLPMISSAAVISPNQISRASSIEMEVVNLNSNISQPNLIADRNNDNRRGNDNRRDNDNRRNNARRRVIIQRPVVVRPPVYRTPVRVVQPSYQIPVVRQQVRNNNIGEVRLRIGF